ncbi:hypothetical protein [Agromyces bauzanensis]
MSIWDFFVWFFWFYVAVACLWIFISVFIDVFRDETLNGWAKAVWVLFLVFVPFLAVIVYIIARGHSMSARAARSREMVPDTVDVPRASTASAASEIESAKRLADSGAIKPAEYDQLKANALRTTA